MRVEIEQDHSSTGLAENSVSAIAGSSSESGEHLREGIKAAQAGDRVSARASLLRAAELEPRCESAWLWLSSISEYPEELLVFLTNVLEINPHNARAIEWSAATRSLLAKNLVHRGIDAVETGQNDSAHTHFTQALEYDDRNTLAWLWLASITTSDEEKLSHLTKVLEIEPDNAQAISESAAIRAKVESRMLNDARAAVVAGDAEAANTAVANLLASQPGSVDAWMLKAHLSARFEDKIKAFEHVLQLDPANEAARASLNSLKMIFASATVHPESDLHADNGDEPTAEVMQIEAVEIVDEERANMGESDSSPFAAFAENDERLSDSDSPQAGEDTGPIDYEIVESTWRSGPEAHQPGPTSSQFSETAPSWPEDSSIFGSPAINDLDVASSYAEFYDPDEEIANGSVGENIVYELVEEDITEEPHSSLPDDTDSEFSDHDGDSVNGLRQDESDLSDNYQFESDDDDRSIEAIGGFSSVNPFASPAFAVESAEPMTLVSIELDEETRAAIDNYAPSFQANANDPEDTNKQASAFDSTMFGTDLSVSSIEPDHDADPPQRDPWPRQADDQDAEGPVVAPCPFCNLENDAQAVACHACFAVLTLSDLELILANQNADKNAIRKAVDRMESERTRREFSEAELVILGIGHLNLRNLQYGYNCLHEASQQNPNNVVLSGQVNALLIRLDEIKRQEESHSSMVTGKTILVVDDSPTVRKLIAGKLEKCGHEVHCSSDGVEAIEQLESIRPDLVLLDITMPRMDGYQVCKIIRSNNATKDVPVIMISGKDGFFDKVRGRMAGTSGYITKPFGPEALMKAVESYLRGEGEIG